MYDLYQAQLERYGVLDFDDILLKVLALFEQQGRNVKQENRLTQQFSYLLVDEFQDINVMQYRLIKAWAKSSASVFIIGDPDQSIYGFRGSDPRCFEQFLKDFSPQKILLSQNYRSTPEILRCARSVIANTGEQNFKRVLEAKRESGIKTRVLEAADPFSEALFIAKEINRMAGGLDMLDAHTSSVKHPSSENLKGFADIAILYRTNRQAYTLEQCLLKEDIPYVVAGRDDFLSEPSVRFALAFFRFLINPADLVSLRVCLKSADVGPAAFRQKAIESYAACNEGFSSLLGIFDALPSSAIGNAHRLLDLLQKYVPLVHKEKPCRLLEAWMRDNALFNESCMEMLLNTSVMHENMPDFLQNLTLGVEGDVTRSGKRHYTPEAVTLMTLHGAKGLEFPVVFLCGANEGMIPFCTHQGECNPEEERRLFYVGVTRAKDELVLITSGAPSPFLADLPEDTLIRDVVRAARPAPASKQFTFFDVL